MEVVQLMGIKDSFSREITKAVKFYLTTIGLGSVDF